MRTGYLKKDRQERYNSKRGWFVNAWRIVDATGKDMIQPWSSTKTEARDICKKLDIALIEDESLLEAEIKLNREHYTGH